MCEIVWAFVGVRGLKLFPKGKYCAPFRIFLVNAQRPAVESIDGVRIVLHLYYKSSMF